MNYLQKFGKISVFALLVVMPSVTFASSVVTSQTYVDMQDALKVNINQGVGTNNANVGKALVVGNDGNVTLGSAVGDANVIETVQVNGNALTVNNKTVNVPVMGAAAAGTAGTVGLVPASSAGDQDKYLKADGTWAVPTNTTYSNVVGADGTNAGTAGLVPAPAAADNVKYLKGDGTWAEVDALPSGTAANQMLQYNTTNNKWGVVNIDTTPTAGNTVPVTSGGVKTGLDAKQTKPTSGVANGKVLTYSCANDPTLCSDANTSVSAAYVTVPVAAGAPSTNTPTAFSEVWVQSL